MSPAGDRSARQRLFPEEREDFEAESARTGKLLRRLILGSVFLYVGGIYLLTHVDTWPPGLLDIRRSRNDLYAIIFTIGYFLPVLLLALIGYRIDHARQRWFKGVAWLSTFWLLFLGLGLYVVSSR
jgi:hypothetical protein